MITTTKRLSFLFWGLFLAHFLNAQVGINTRSPQGVFHVDAKGDTNGNLNVSDDVVVMPNGYVGVGTNQPTANLDIRGKFKYVDGNQSDSYVLKTDAAGNATWAPPPQSIKQLTFANGVTDHKIGGLLGGKVIGNGAGFIYVGVSITLPPGTWMITFCATFVLDKTGITGDPRPTSIWWDLSTSATSNLPFAGRVLSSTVGGVATSMYAPVNAAYFVTHTTATTYYMWGYPNNYKFTYTGEGYMWAMKLLPK